MEILKARNESNFSLAAKTNNNPNSLLELGLGHGYSANVFANYFKRHLVLEGDNGIIKNYQDSYFNNKTEIKEIFFENFSTTEKFDVIVLGFILEHIEKPVKILKQYREFLSKGGTMFLTVPNAKALNRRVGKLAGLLEDMFCLSENDIALGHKRYYDTESLTCECTQANLDIKRLEGIFLKPLTTKQLLHLNLDKKILASFCEVGIQYPELCTAILAEVCPR
jgi:SAM-dependent methyltransferase